MDQHVPGAITAGLRHRGVDVLTALEDGTAAWADHALLQRATDLGRTLFSQDSDLLVITAQWLAAGRQFAGLVYAEQMAITIGQAIADLELIAKICDPAEMLNQIMRIPI